MEEWIRDRHKHIKKVQELKWIKQNAEQGGVHWISA